jgi:hypothetical protein
MTSQAFADEWERAADWIVDVSRADVQMLLRRTALEKHLRRRQPDASALQNSQNLTRVNNGAT